MPEMLRPDQVTTVAVPTAAQPVAQPSPAPTQQAQPQQPVDPFKRKPGPPLLLIPHTMEQVQPVQQARGGKPVRLNHDRSLIAGLAHSNPADAAPWLVFADHLDEQGYEHLAHAIRHGEHIPDSDVGNRRMDDLQNTHGDVILGATEFSHFDEASNRYPLGESEHELWHQIRYHPATNQALLRLVAEEGKGRNARGFWLSDPKMIHRTVSDLVQATLASYPPSDTTGPPPLSNHQAILDAIEGSGHGPARMARPSSSPHIQDLLRALQANPQDAGLLRKLGLSPATARPPHEQPEQMSAAGRLRRAVRSSRRPERFESAQAPAGTGMVVRGIFYKPGQMVPAEALEAHPAPTQAPPPRRRGGRLRQKIRKAGGGVAMGRRGASVKMARPPIPGEFLRQMTANLDDQAPGLVFADWLEENGYDRLAELHRNPHSPGSAVAGIDRDAHDLLEWMHLAAVLHESDKPATSQAIRRLLEIGRTSGGNRDWTDDEGKPFRKQLWNNDDMLSLRHEYADGFKPVHMMIGGVHVGLAPYRARLPGEDRPGGQRATGNPTHFFVTVHSRHEKERVSTSTRDRMARGGWPVPRQLAEQMMHEADLFFDPRGDNIETFHPDGRYAGRSSESEAAAMNYIHGVH